MATFDTQDDYSLSHYHKAKHLKIEIHFAPTHWAEGDANQEVQSWQYTCHLLGQFTKDATTVWVKQHWRNPSNVSMV